MDIVTYYSNRNDAMLIYKIFYFFGSLYSTNKTYVEWQASPTITTINTIAYPIKNIEFPAITICSQGAAKDVMDNVLLQQFEDYLRIRGVAARASSNQNNDAAGKRKKRSVTSIADTLSSEEVLFCRFQ